MMFKPEVIKQKKGENRRSENSRNTRCYHKTSKKCQGKTITDEGSTLDLLDALFVSPPFFTFMALVASGDGRGSI